MSFLDSQIDKQGQIFPCCDMGISLVKESDAEGDEELSENKDFELKFCDCDENDKECDAVSINQDDNDYLKDSNEKERNYNGVEEAYERLSQSSDNSSDAQNQINQEIVQQSCDSCVNSLSSIDPDSLAEIKLAQAHWMELRQFIRSIYRMAMEGSKSVVLHYESKIKDLVNKLCLHSPHLLFQRLEQQVQEFVIEAKVRLLELLHREKDSPQLSYLFLTGLLDGYRKLMFAADQIGPLLEQLQKDHLNRFNINWKVLNQHLYQSCVYTDPLVQNNLPHFISELSNCNGKNSEANTKLVHDFLSFDDELTLFGGMWRNAEARIHEYNQELATIKAKERMLKEDWKIFKERRKLFQQEMWNKTLSEMCNSNANYDDNNLPGYGCTCKECHVSNILSSGILTPPTSPVISSYNGNHSASENCNTNEEVVTLNSSLEEENICECHVCTAPPININGCDNESIGFVNNPSASAISSNLPSIMSGQVCGVAGSIGTGGGFHLPHIHGTGGGVTGSSNSNISLSSNVYPHLYNIHTTLLQHHNGLPGTGIGINNSNADKSMTTTLQPTVNTTTTITTTTVINDHPQITTDCEMGHSTYKSSIISKPVTVKTRPDTPPPSVNTYLGVSKYMSGISVLKKSNGVVPAITESSKQRNENPVVPPAATHYQQQQQRTHRHSTTQTTPQPQPLQSNVVSQSTMSNTDHHTHSTTNQGHNGHQRIRHHPDHHNNVPQNSNGVPLHSCHKHGEPIKRVSAADAQVSDDYDSASPEDSCSERSSSTQRDSKHCDCCYCEVFGHGVPSVAPVSRNYQEMRERLRQLLTKKKAKCKSASGLPISNNQNNISNVKKPTLTANGTQSSSNTPSTISTPSSSSTSLSSVKHTAHSVPSSNVTMASESSSAIKVQKDPRDLKELLDFIEGNSGKIKDAKKAAKKARQKQKKQDEIDRKKREEEEAERRRQELIIQQQKQQAALLKKQQQQQQKQKKKGKKNNNNNNNNNNSNNNNNNNRNSNNNNKNSNNSNNNLSSSNKNLNNNSNSNSGTQMVTIKRVMEPNSAEPTVTITLRGATPSEDKVLYTLMNGQVCKVDKESNKNSKSKKQPQKIPSENVNKKSKNSNKNSANINNNIINSNPGQPKNKKNANNTNNNNKNNNTNNNNIKKENNNMVHIKMKDQVVEISRKNNLQLNGNNNIKVMNPVNNNKSAPSSQPAPTISTPPQLTSPTAIQINNAINKLSSKPNMNNFSIDNLKLPPGITITKVDPATIQERRIQPKTTQSNAKDTTITPSSVPPVFVPPKQASSNVIVVDTGRIKALNNELNNDEVTSTTGGKKKKKKNKGSNNVPPTINDQNNLPNGLINGNGTVRLVNGAAPWHPPNGKMAMPQSAAIIKVNGSMVTIRSPAFQQALENKPDEVTIVSVGDQNKKRRKKKKGANGQRQPDEWNLLDSVFAPKDIDLDNGDIDDDERELEAFKRFCLQSVPPKQKEKVHLNIKDIVLKKKSSAISCS